MRILNCWKISVSSEVEMLIFRVLDCPDGLIWLLSLRYLCLASLYCPGASHWLTCPICCHQCPEHPGARCCWRPTVTPSPRFTLKTPPPLHVLSISHFHHHPVRMGEGCLSSSLPAVTISNLTLCDYASAAGGSSYLTKKSCFPSCEWEC